MSSNTEKSLNPSQGNESVRKLLSDIKVGKIKGSLPIALATLNVLEEIISKAENTKALQLVSLLQAAGGALARGAAPHTAAANVARRVLRAVRTETRANADQSGEAASGDSLQKLVLAFPARRGTVGEVSDLRERIRDHILELRIELESTVSSIASQAPEHIDSAGVLLCACDTPLLETFLRRARQPYRLVLPEGPSIQQTHALAARMSASGARVAVITNAAVFAVMSRVTKVLVSVSCVFSSGAFLAAPGTHNVTSAAHFYNVPVLALCPLYKLTPLHAADPQEIPCGNPLDLHDYAEHNSALGRVHSPLRDYISPEHITLFITNLGGSSPSYIYRTMSELYDPADNEL